MASPKFEILGCIAKILESKAHAKYKGWLHPASKRKEGGAGDPSHCRWGLPVRRRQRQVSAAGQGRRTTDQSCGCFIRATSHPRQGRGVAAFLSYRVIEPPLHGCCSVCVPLGVKRAATLGIVDGRRDAVAKRCCDEDEDVIAVRLGVGGEQLLRATQGQLRLGRGEVASSSSFFPSLLCVVWRRWRGSTPGRISQGWARSQWG